MGGYNHLDRLVDAEEKVVEELGVQRLGEGVARQPRLSRAGGRGREGQGEAGAVRRGCETKGGDARLRR